MDWFKAVIFALFVVLISGCSSQEPPKEVYRVAFRKFPPEPVYGRVMWSHLPQPVQPKTREEAPYLMPVIYFDLPNSNLGEAIEALAQTMGYRPEYPNALAVRPVRIRMEGSIAEVLQEISKQTGVQTVMDHDSRVLRVKEREMQPSLPDSY